MTREQKRSLLLIAAAAVLLIGLHFVPVTGWLKLVLYLIPYLLVGGETLVDACKGIYNRQPFDENLLMAVATIGAMVLGDYPEAVSVMLFYQIGELFESYAVGRSRRNIGDLMDIRPDFAYVETADGIVRVKPEEVAVGDTIVIKPGERVPLDGTVLTGTSALNMSALTGESAPVDVTEGSTVVSGSVNLSGVLRLRVEKVYAESTVARILELVENSSLKKAHTERFITKFARVYTPSVCGAALALAILPPVVRLIMGIPAEWGDWIYRALTFLVISCPCALVISIPLSFFGGIGGASARGILIKGSSYLEMLAKTDRVVFDKTGTLTRGTFAVTAVHPAQPELSEQALLQLAAAAEQFSDHPVSQSLRRAAGELPADLVTTDAKELAGHGVTAQVGGRSVAAGNTKLMDTLGLTVPGELLRSGVNLLGAIIILALFWFGFLNAGSLFGLQYLMMGSIVIGCLAIMRRSWAHIDLSLTRDQRLSYTREFSDYSMPLFVQALLSALALSAERWVLQWFDGSTQQGYFALSQRVSAACFLFVSAMTPLIMRELAIAWGKDDREHMGHLLTRFAPLLFGIAAWFSCFTAVEASVLVHIFGGAEFAAALVPVQIMALYPAHQAYGQLASSVFHATGKTKVLRNLAFIEHFGGFLLVWLLVAPQDMLGMGLGATGLALKTVTTQFIMVNLLFWMASRLIPLNFFRNLMLQGLILGSLLGIAWVCKQATGIYFADDAHQVIRFFLSGILYSFMSFGLVVTCPWLFGCSWQDFREMLIRLRLIKRKA